MTTVAYIDAELRASSDKYVRAHNQAATATTRYSNTAQSAYRKAEAAQSRVYTQSVKTATAGKKLGEAFSIAANNVAVLDGRWAASPGGCQRWPSA